MKKPNFTPGPWTDGKHVSICNQDDARLSLGFLSTSNHARRAEGFANAKLIAASPMLAEAGAAALKELHAMIAEMGGCDHSVGICQCDTIRAASDLESALIAAGYEVEQP